MYKRQITGSAGVIGGGTGHGLSIYFGFAWGTDYHGTNNTWGTGTYATNATANGFMSTVGNEFFLTGVQLEVGSAATPFEHRSFGEELMLCRRYYQENKVGWYGVYSASGYFESDTINYVPICRANPTTAQVSFSGGSRTSSSAITSNNQTGAIVYASPSSSGGNESWSAVWSADAEL